MVNQVGSPAILDGNMFLPETGTPIWKIERISTVLAVWLPDPLTVATCMEKSLTTVWPGSAKRGSAGETSSVDIYQDPLCGMWRDPLIHYSWSRGSQARCEPNRGVQSTKEDGLPYRQSLYCEHGRCGKREAIHYH